MTPKEHLTEALRALCKTHSVEVVADAIGSSVETLQQIIKGTKLPKSGNPRGVGPTLQRRLEAAFPGWALLAPQPAAAPAVPPRLAALLVDLMDLPEAQQSKYIDLIHEAAELARASHAHLAEKEKRAPSMAASVDRPAKASLTLRYGDGNPDQGTLALTTVPDPFTAEPGPREQELYHRFARDRDKQIR